MKNIEIIESLQGNTFKFLSDYSQIAVLVDENTVEYCYPLVQKLFPKHSLIEIKSGEEYKNLETCTEIWERLTKLGFDRHSVLLNLGGGVIGDMGGFCASTYKRGIDFVQIPTTLLSQVDASVGGKLGIDFYGFKNHIGLFQEPNQVVICSAFLKTLPDRQMRSGFAEVVKHAFIRDAKHWAEIKSKKINEQDWHKIISHSVQLKYEVVEADPTERNLRKILNFGHTIGHAVESFFLEKRYRKLFHGEAVAIGMIAEAYISFRKNFISGSEYFEIRDYLIQVFGKVEIKASELTSIAELAIHDKKNKEGVILASLLESVGTANYNQEITLDEIKEALQVYEEA
ncbi:MAG: 3-dehydroquinate synthase [Arenicella sp.]|jgi:3-dehydroquinate synthase